MDVLQDGTASVRSTLGGGKRLLLMGLPVKALCNRLNCIKIFGVHCIIPNIVQNPGSDISFHGSIVQDANFVA